MDREYKFTETHRQRLSLAHKGQKSWNKGTVGKMAEPWNKGISVHLSPRTEFKKGSIPWNKGKKLSLDHCKNLSLSHIGFKPTKETIKKRIESAKRGEHHHMWKGKKVGYEALHGWVKRAYGPPTKCENLSCVYPRMSAKGERMEKARRFEWSNVSGHYLRERDDWKMLCPSCHRKIDQNRSEPVKNEAKQIRLDRNKLRRAKLNENRRSHDMPERGKVDLSCDSVS